MDKIVLWLFKAWMSTKIDSGAKIGMGNMYILILIMFLVCPTCLNNILPFKYTFKV